MTGLLLIMMGCGDKSESEETGASDAEPVVDSDSDGFDTTTDCDDTNDAINPDASEVCDGIDNDCDDRIDDGLTDAYFTDSDGDSYGAYGDVLYDCEDPGAGYVLVAGDCDDGDSAVYPGAEEICDGIDNDCGGVADEGLLFVYYLDDDGDGFGDPSTDTEECESPGEDYVEQGEDCDDADASTYPGAEELCDGVDSNCLDDLAEALWESADGAPATDLTAELAAGTAEAPAVLSLNEPGTLSLCEGTAYARLNIEADVSVLGSGDVVLSGGGLELVAMVSGGSQVLMQDLTIADGAGDMGAGLSVGGAASVSLDAVSFFDNTAATAGGAIFVDTDSSVSGVGVIFDGNAPDDISRGGKKSYTADKKGDFTCDFETDVCE
ncbi:MAG: putative outer membrane repeat protein [Myxococcota bacterium]|jgi:predicted outer membrane repeat protein